MSKVSNSSKDKKQVPPVSFCSSISSNGLETHKVETEDGYILSLFRLKDFDKGEDGGESGEKCDGGSMKDNKLPPVLMIPGMFNDGMEWLLLEREGRAIPNILAKQGFDCWMGANRGTPHSKGHTSLKTSSKKFWDFGFDEMSKYDIPALIDYILKVTGNKDLFFLGYSMGGAMILSTLCLRPEYHKKVRAVAAMAPGVYGHDFKTSTVKFGVPLVARARSKFIYRRPIGTKSVTDMVNMVIPSFTKINRESLAGSWMKLLGRMGGSIGPGCRTDREMYNRLAEHMPAPTSIKYAVHVAQMFSSKKFQMFDYGRAGNLKRHGTPKPPLYNLSKVTVPVATFTADHDCLIPAKGVLRISAELPNLISHTVISYPKFSHCDFILGRDVHLLVYPKIVQIFKKYSNLSTSPTINRDIDTKTMSEPNDTTHASSTVTVTAL